MASRCPPKTGPPFAHKIRLPACMRKFDRARFDGVRPPWQLVLGQLPLGHLTRTISPLSKDWSGCSLGRGTKRHPGIGGSIRYLKVGMGSVPFQSTPKEWNMNQPSYHTNPMKQVFKKTQVEPTRHHSRRLMRVQVLRLDVEEASLCSRHAREARMSLTSVSSLDRSTHRKSVVPSRRPPWGGTYFRDESVEVPKKEGFEQVSEVSEQTGL